MARHDLLGGCGLPEAWADAAQWRILEIGFRSGINFLTSWQAWRADPHRPRLLHYVATEPNPVAPHDLLRAARQAPELAPLAQALAAQGSGLLPGVHRLSFEHGRVLLTLCLGPVQPMLRALQRFDADSIYLDSPVELPHMPKAVARFARPGTRIAAVSATGALRGALAQCGFRIDPIAHANLHGVYAPAWTPRRRAAPDAAMQTDAPTTCAVIGAGLAGAAVAAQLALRGWPVTVLDAAAQPAAGASGLPVGLLAPHVSPDDALLSRLTRAGVRATWAQLQALLVEGRDWCGSGVIERRAADAMRVPATWQAGGPNQSWCATAEQLGAAGLPPDTPALWHARAGWVKPAALVRAWLATPGVRFEGGRRVTSLDWLDGQWRLRNAAGTVLARAARVVVAAGVDSLAFAPALPLSPVRGQLLWGRAGALPVLPSIPLNGDGHLLGRVPDAQQGALWLAGATYARDDADGTPRAVDTQAIRERLARLHPAASEALASAFANGEVHAWAGVRCASGDRRPLVGPVDALNAPGLWVSTAMGSRGLSFAALCGELLAARWLGEPLPLTAALAHALDTRRLATMH